MAGLPRRAGERDGGHLTVQDGESEGCRRAYALALVFAQGREKLQERTTKMSYFKKYTLRMLGRKTQGTDVTDQTGAYGYGRTAALLACIAGAIYLAQGNHDGWGWLIFLALVIA